ncbi:bifunctional tetrahydrofolate synthase/dihydrofolate synthase [Buchnera aphidicola (Takecallis taiwana)]|uniref:bifunctional tetrahydrofolate synthase/dihydrofolate synthase n=1 Tax=Buchnera aphidicola TaxID=9 RepID=UPI0031B68054
MKDNFSDKQILLLKWLKYIKLICLKDCNDSIDNIKYIAKKLNLLTWSAFIITISGTNGKGSTSAVLEKIFLNLGYTVGLYSSPHLLYYYERIRVNGQYIHDPMIHITVLQRIVLMSKNIKLSYFEFITLSALLIFQSYNLDIIILEVGLGGRLDATNIIDPNIAIITNIGLEHTHYLGKSRNNIGYEKSGIFRKNIIAIIGDNNIPYSVYQAANFFKVFLYRVQYEWYWVESKHYWNFYDQRGMFINLPIPAVSLPSSAIAIAALRAIKLDVSRKILVYSLKQVFLPGRFHTIYTNPRIIVDVAHNAHATRYLNKKLQSLFTDRNVKIYGVFGILSDKDIKNTTVNLINVIDFWYYTVLQTDRTATLDSIKCCLPKNSIFSFSIKHVIYHLIRTVKKQDIILVFGSFFAVSEAITAISNLYD